MAKNAGHIKLINVLKDIKITEINHTDMLGFNGIKSPTLIFVVKGEAEAYLDEVASSIGEGNLICIHPGSLLRMRNRLPDNIFQYYQIAIEQYELISILDNELKYHLQYNNLPQNGFLTEKLPHRAFIIMKELTECFSSMEENDQIHYLLKELLELYLLADTRHTNTVFSSTCAYIDEHYHEKITRSFMAEMIGYNPRYFSSFFKKQMGWNFSDYLAYVRVNKAKEYLLTSNAPLNDIAYKVGYADGSSLSKKFKSLVGMSPSDFRLKRKPERIIALQFLGDMLALGIKPIASTDEVLNDSQLLQTDLSGVVDVGKVPLDELAADLIIVPTYYYYVNPERIRQMEKIAPVLMVNWGNRDLLKELRFFGELLGREQQAEDWIAAFKEKVEQSKRRIEHVKKRNETVALYEFWDDQHIRIWDRTARAAYNLYDMLEITAPERVQKEVLDAQNHLVIPEDRLPEYAADHMFIVACEKSGYLQSLKKTIENHPVWKSIPAVQKQQIYFLKQEEFRFCEAYALEKQLEIQVRHLLKETSETDYLTYENTDLLTSTINE